MPSTNIAQSAHWRGTESSSPTEPTRLILRQKDWRGWIAPLVSIAVVCAVAAQIDKVDLRHVLSLVPASPLFWAAYATWYLIGPICDWIIFRRLWKLPVAGFVALVRKLISNELLLGYLGEAYFYGWARARAGLSGSPFGAIKDVAILSALTGNIVTIAMLVAIWPLVGALHLGIEGRALLISVGVVVATSALLMVLRRRLFTLPARDLRFIAFMQLARIAAMTLLAACMWHLALPMVGVTWWLLLATIRLLISRLPFIPGKDLVFAGVAIFLVGRDAQIADALTMIGGLTLAMHLIIGAALAMRDVIGLGLREA